MGTQKRRLESVEGQVRHLRGLVDDPLAQFTAADFAGALSEILGKPVPVAGRGRGLRAARAAMTALSVPDLRAVLAWLRVARSRQGQV